MKISVRLLCSLVTACCLMISCYGDNKKEKFKILGLFSHPGKSHFDVFLPLLEELAHRGHDVTVVSYFPRKEKIPNYKDISLAAASKIYVNIFDLQQRMDHSSTRLYFELELIQTFAELSCKSSLEIPAVRELINSNEKFDLIITEMFNSDCFLGFVHKFKAPFIGITSHYPMAWTNPRLGNPDNPSYIPTVFTFSTPEMNFFDRVQNTIFLILSKTAYHIFFSRPTQVLAEKHFGPGVPPLEDIGNNMSALLINTHFSLHGSRPLSQSVVEVGGLHIRDNKPLPKNLKDFLDSSKQGVLYFSLGSMIKAATLPKEKLDMIVRVLGSLKHNVVWKWEDEELPNKPKNVMIQKWLPQFDVLSHPNVKGFLTHGGLLGLSEGIYVGVPMLVVPIFGDQFFNAAAAAGRGAAKVLQYEDITEETLRDSLNEILNNPSYRKNAQAVSKAYKDRPASALETAVWWSEYIARGEGQPFLRSASANLSWFQYYLLDVIAFISLVTLGFLFVVVFAIKSVFKILCGKEKEGRKPKANSATKNGLDKKRA